MRTTSVHLFAVAALFAVTATAPTAGAQSALSVDTMPTRDIAGLGDDGELRFARALGAGMLSDGTIAVADIGSEAVKLVGPDGTVRTVGRKGNGPGEFRMVAAMSSCGKDSLLVRDYLSERLTLIGGDGAILYQEVAATHPAFVDCASGGRLAVLRRPGPGWVPPSADEGWINFMLTLASLESKSVTDIGEVHAFQYSRASGPTVRPLGAMATFALTDRYLYLGTGDSAAIDVLNLDGKRVRTIRLNSLPRKPTPAHIVASATALVALQPEFEIREARKRKLMRVPMPPSVPPYSALLADPAGNVWVVLSVPGDPATHLQAFDFEGRQLADAVIPRPLVIYEVGRDYLLASFEDSEGEQHIQVYSIRSRTRSK